MIVSEMAAATLVVEVMADTIGHCSSELLFERVEFVEPADIPQC